MKLFCDEVPKAQRKNVIERRFPKHDYLKTIILKFFAVKKKSTAKRAKKIEKLAANMSEYLRSTLLSNIKSKPLNRFSYHSKRKKLNSR